VKRDVDYANRDQHLDALLIALDSAQELIGALI
jgi:hypothetical protein